MQSNNPILEQALSNAELGLYQYVCHGIDPNTKKCTCGRKCDKPGKHPIYELGPWNKKHTRDPEVLEALFKRYPYANLIIPAEPNYLVITDIDGPLGFKLFDHIATTHEEWINTPIERTGGNGFHVFHRQPATRIMNGFNGPGYEIKILNYVVVAPSVHLNGNRYMWFTEHRFKEKSIMELPDGYREFLENLSFKKSGEGKQGQGKPMGERRCYQLVQQDLPAAIDRAREPTPEDRRHGSIWLNVYVRKALQTRNRTNTLYGMGCQLNANMVPLSYALELADDYAEIVNSAITEKPPMSLDKARNQIRNAYRAPRMPPAVRQQAKAVS